MGKARKRRGAGNAVRIIAGRWRGRRIDFPAGSAARPTPNRVRETLFNWLQPGIAGAVCLDLFAGSGALGIEALSRGAARVVFVERDRASSAALQAQLAGLGAAAQAEVVTSSAEHYLAGAVRGQFDIVFVDPPFALDPVPLLDSLEGMLKPGGLLYLEQPLERGLPSLGWASWTRTGKAARVCFGLAARPA